MEQSTPRDREEKLSTDTKSEAEIRADVLTDEGHEKPEIGILPKEKRPWEESVAQLDEKKRTLYLPVRSKFLICTFAACLWFFFSLSLAQPWLKDLSGVVGEIPAFVIIFFIALLPGFLNAHILTSVILDKPPTLRSDLSYPPISILIAAYNEAENLPETFRGIKGQDYPAEVEIIVVDDGSSDNTVEVLNSLQLPNLKIVQAKHGGKAKALNEGLKSVTNDIVVCIDADTFLHAQALKRVVGRFLTDPAHTAAVAGCVLVKNSRASFMTRLQEWDYFTGIASAKRQQSLYQGTLVAQGSFSAFRTKILRSQQGWPSVIGEDIVLTWALLKEGWRVGFEPTAIGFTMAPTDFAGFFRQRRRWARGMIEGLKQHGHMVWKRSHLPAFFVAIDFIIPFIDFFYAFAFLPGIVLALFGYFYIVGPLTLLVIPIAFLIVLVMYQKQKAVFNAVNLKVRRNFGGFFIYMLVYQAVMSPICVIGYLQELLGMTKRW